MPTNISPTGASNGPIRAPSDGDLRNGTAFQVPFQDVANMIAGTRLRDRITRRGKLSQSSETSLGFRPLGAAATGLETAGFQVMSVGRQTGSNTDSSQLASTVEAFSGSNDLSPLGVAYHDNTSFIAAGYDNTASLAFVQRFSGGSWSIPTVSGLPNAPARSVRALKDRVVVIAGTKVFWTLDGTTWSSSEPASGVTLQDIAYNAVNDEWLVVTDPNGAGGYNSGALISDDDLATWTRHVADGAGVAGDGLKLFAKAVAWGYDAAWNQTYGMIGTASGDVITGHVTAAGVVLQTVLASAGLPWSHGNGLIYSHGLWFTHVSPTGGGIYPLIGGLVDGHWERLLLTAGDSAAFVFATPWDVRDGIALFAAGEASATGEVYMLPKLCTLELGDPEAYP